MICLLAHLLGLYCTTVHNLTSIVYCRDYPRLYLESDYGQRTDRENDLDTDLERAEKAQSQKR